MHRCIADDARVQVVFKNHQATLRGKRRNWTRVLIIHKSDDEDDEEPYQFGPQTFTTLDDFIQYYRNS